MKIFVTGGTGSVGSLLVDNLLDAGHEVTVITRSLSNVDNDWKDRVRLVEGNVVEDEDWVNHIEGHDAIINLVGENVFGKRWTASQKERLYNSRVKPTRKLVDKVKSMGTPPSVFVQVSGTEYPYSRDQVFTEEDELGDSFLGELMEDWEAPVHELRELTTRHVIMRMGTAFSYSGENAERMFYTHKFFVGGWVGSGRQIYSWVHIKDFVGLLQWAAETETAEGIYNGVAPDYKPMKELAQIGGEIMGRWTWTWAPGFVLKIVLGQRANIILNGRPVSSKKVQEAGYEFQYPTAKEALQDILKDF